MHRGVANLVPSYLFFSNLQQVFFHQNESCIFPANFYDSSRNHWRPLTPAPSYQTSLTTVTASNMWMARNTELVDLYLTVLTLKLLVLDRDGTDRRGIRRIVNVFAFVSGVTRRRAKPVAKVDHGRLKLVSRSKPLSKHFAVLLREFLQQQTMPW